MEWNTVIYLMPLKTWQIIGFAHGIEIQKLLEYPDIIKEFLVDYYIPKYEWIGFSQAARLGTVTQFDMFLLHAIEDFPDKKSYMEDFTACIYMT